MREVVGVDLGSSTPVTAFTSEEIFNRAITRDGKLVLARGHHNTDAILIRDFH